MKISNLNLPEHVTVKSFSSREQLAHELATQILDDLSTEIATQGSASLAVSGGSTPLPLFKELSQSELDWSKVTITLVDDRWVDPEDPASNECLVKDNLLTGHAKAANFIGFWQPNSSAEEAISASCQKLNSLDKPITSVILGMGNDGHTASIFPCSKELSEALDCNESCIAVTPTTAPYKRVSLTAKRLLNSEHRVLHICGEDKLETLAKALADNEPLKMPISFFLRHPLTIFWSP